MSTFTTHEAADRLGLTARSVARLVKRGRIVATKRGRDYLIDLSEVDRYAAERREPGRPKKGTNMHLYDIHARLYAGLPEGTIINICELSDDDARLVSDNAVQVAQALGHTGDKLTAAQEGDTWHIDAELTRRFRAMIAEFGVEQP